MARYGHNKNTRRREAWNVRTSKVNREQARQRVDLDPFQFDDLIRSKGTRVKVYRTIYCPKVKSVDGAEHEIDCDMCNGSGWVDLEPLCTVAYIQSQELESIQASQGLHDGNTVLMSFPIGVELQYFTRVDLLDHTDIYFQRVKRKEGSDVDVLQFPACRVNLVLDFDGVRYYQDQDFEINVDGNVKWGKGNTPADGVIYSVHYEAAQQYRCTQAMHVNRFSQVKGEDGVEALKFPEQWALAKEFLVRRTDVNGNELKQGPYDDHEIVNT
jgi:hypothetical protein